MLLITNQSLLGGRRRRRRTSSLWCLHVLLLLWFVLLEHQSSAVTHRQDHRPLLQSTSRNHYSDRRIRGLQTQLPPLYVDIRQDNNVIHNDASSSSVIVNLNSSPTPAPTIKIQELVIHMRIPPAPKDDDPKETTKENSAVATGDDEDWTRYRDKSRPATATIPSCPPPTMAPRGVVLNQQEIITALASNETTTTTNPSNAPIGAKKNSSSSNHDHKEDVDIPLNTNNHDHEEDVNIPLNTNNNKANDDLEYENSNDSAGDVIIVQSVDVELESNQNTIMNDEDILIFEHVCETEFLPVYLPRVYSNAAAATTNYTDIKCIVVDQIMENRFRRILQGEQQQQQQPQQHQQRQQQVANVQLESKTFSTLLQILSTVDLLPAGDSFRFTDIVAQTFMEYSHVFQDQLSQQSSYFVSSKQVEMVIPDGLQIEEPSTSANDSLSLAAKVGLGIGGCALAVALILFGHRISSRGSRNGNNERSILPTIAPVESLVSCIEPNEGGGFQVGVSNKQKIIDEDDDEEGMETTAIDLLAAGDDTNGAVIVNNNNGSETASQVFQRIISETKELMTRSLGSNNKSNNNNHKPVDMIVNVVGSCSVASDDISSVTQASSIASINNNANNDNNRHIVSAVSSPSCVGAFLAQLVEMQNAAIATTTTRRDDKEEEAAGGYPIPQIRDLPIGSSAQISSNDSVEFFGGPATTDAGSLRLLEWFRIADSLSTAVGLTTQREASNLSSMLGDLSTTGEDDSASSSTTTDDNDDNDNNNIALMNSGCVETSLSGVVNDESSPRAGGDADTNNNAK